MTSSIVKQQIQHIIADLDKAYHFTMIASKKEEELYEKKYAISDWIYCLYANEEKTGNTNPDYRSSLDWLIKQFYQSKENIAHWDKNWVIDDNSTVYAKRFGKFCISKNGQYKLVSPEEFISSDSAHQQKFVDLKIKRLEIFNNSWFYFKGNKYLGTSFLTRLYFNFNYDFEKIVAFSKTLCDELNQWYIPFEYKFATKATNRYDTGVLYTSQEYYYIVFYLIKKIVSGKQYADLFGEETLAFTQRTALKGISFGEEPPVRSSSFGRYRADIMADSYIDYYKKLKTGKKAPKLDHFILNTLIEVGFNTKDFFRNPNTHYPYDFSIFKRKAGSGKASSIDISDKYLFWALNAGKLICKQAIIINQKSKVNCFWLSSLEDEAQSEEYKLVDNSFTNGRLGIIYFLARLYSYFPHEYIFKDICEIVLTSVHSTDALSYESNSHYINQIKKYLKSKNKPSKINTKKVPVSSEKASFLTKEIDSLLENSNTYSVVSNHAPQPIVHKGYSAIGMTLLGIYEKDTFLVEEFEVYYAKEAFLKLINHTIF